MYNNIIIIFLIMLFGLILCSFLGGNCGNEGFQSNSSSNSSKKPANNGGRNSIDDSTDVNSSSTNSYDNYNHYDGSSHASVFYGPDGGTAKIIQNDGKAAISITGPDGQTETFAVNTNGNGNGNGYTGPNGATATIAKSDDGKQIIKVTTSNGELVSYSEDSVHVTTTDNMNDVGNNVDVNQYTGPAGNTVTTVSGGNGNTAAKKTNYNENYDVADVNDVDVDQYTGPRGNTATSVTGPRGNTALDVDSKYNYDEYLPQGIPKNQIPAGDEDLYILKSQVVPPVCPVCPTPSGSYTKEKKCPACPPCGRCPEPAFDCKKVPNYSAFNSKYMPVPVLTSFSGFGM